MARLTTLLVAGAIALVLCLSACGVAFTDDGPYTQQTRTVGDFARVEVHGSADVVVRRGWGGVVTVKGGRHRVDDVITRVADDTLVIEGRDSSGTIDLGDGNVTVVARTPSLSGARIDGSGDLTLPELGGRRLEIEVNGSGDVRADGRVDRIDAEVDGSGDLDLRELRAGSASLDLAGSGDADVDAARRLDVAIHGSGDVRYSGDPQLRQRVEGSGNVERG